MGAAVAVTGLLAFTLAPSAEAASPLAEYRPVLRYDADEDYRAQPASPGASRVGRDLVYGHVARDGGVVWLQYWLFYAYNDQDRGIFATGRHEGDWEFVQLRLDPDGAPETITYAQHSTAERCAVDEVETERVGGVEVPVVFVADGSHASYPRAGTADRPWPDPNDEAGGDIEVRPALRSLDRSPPTWLDDPGPWGASRAGWVPGEQSSPPGPRFQDDGRWARPAAYEAAARACGEPPPGRPWQTPALLGLAAVVVGIPAWLARRR